jgi:hypothetical protein
MSYTVVPYLLKIDELAKVIGSRDQSLMIAVLKANAKKVIASRERALMIVALKADAKLDEGELGAVKETVNDYQYHSAEAVQAIVNGDLNNNRIHGFQYGYGLEMICMYLGEEQCVKQLESVNGSWTFYDMWDWILDSQSPIALPRHNDIFPSIGHFRLADIPKELERTQTLDFGNYNKIEQEMYTEIREGLVELYEKALEKKKDIVTFYY